MRRNIRLKIVNSHLAQRRVSNPACRSTQTQRSGGDPTLNNAQIPDSSIRNSRCTKLVGLAGGLIESNFATLPPRLPGVSSDPHHGAIIHCAGRSLDGSLWPVAPEPNKLPE